MTPGWVDIASVLRSNNSNRLQSSIETPTGTGPTVQGTALYTTITTPRCGIEGGDRTALGEIQGAPFSIKPNARNYKDHTYVRQERGDPSQLAAPEAGPLSFLLCETPKE
jgi:hypothetical protein